MGAGVLAGCASGNAGDSRRFQNMEATHTPQVPGAQSTKMAEQFLRPTGTPEATITPHATITDLALSTSAASGGSTGNSIDTVRAYSSQTVYAVARIGNIQPGQIVSALLRSEDGGIIAAVDLTPSPSTAPQALTFPVPLGGGLAPGVYSIAIVVDGDLLESISFEAR